MKLGIVFTKKTAAINSSTLLCFVFLYRTLGITLHTVRADYDCVVTFSLYQVLNRTIRSAALPYPKHECRRMPAPMRSSCIKYDTSERCTMHRLVPVREHQQHEERHNIATCCMNFS